MGRHHLFFRAAAYLLIVCLLAQDAAPAAEAFSAPAKTVSRTAPSRISSAAAVNSQFGNIDETFQGTNGRHITFILDAHNSIEAQKNIARLIRQAVQQQNVTTVFEEGYEGPLNTDELFASISDEEVRRKVSYYYLEQLKIGGAEFAHINRRSRLEQRTKDKEQSASKALQDNAANGSDWELIGADDREAYLQDVAAFADAEKARAKIANDTEAILRELHILSEKQFSAEAKKWIAEYTRFHENSLPLLDYVNRWIDRIPQDACPILRNILAAEKDPEMALRIQKLRAAEVLNELDFFESYLENNLFKDEAKKIWQAVKVTRGVEKLAGLQVSRHEYMKLKQELVTFKTENIAPMLARAKKNPVVLSRRWEKLIESAVKFYELAHQRDLAVEKALINWSRKPETGGAGKAVSREPHASGRGAVLVFGGFHREGITEILRRNGFSYTVVVPKITDLSKKHERLYRELMSAGSRGVSSRSPAAVQAARPISIFFSTGIKSEIQKLAALAAQNPGLSLTNFSLLAERQFAQAARGITGESPRPGQANTRRISLAALAKHRAEVRAADVVALPAEPDSLLQTADAGRRLTQLVRDFKAYAESENIEGELESEAVWAELLQSERAEAAAIVFWGLFFDKALKEKNKIKILHRLLSRFEISWAKVNFLLVGRVVALAENESFLKKEIEAIYEAQTDLDKDWVAAPMQAARQGVFQFRSGAKFLFFPVQYRSSDYLRMKTAPGEKADSRVLVLNLTDGSDVGTGEEHMAGAFAHIEYFIRSIQGKKALVITEIQSDQFRFLRGDREDLKDWHWAARLALEHYARTHHFQMIVSPTAETLRERWPSMGESLARTIYENRKLAKAGYEKKQLRIFWEKPVRNERLWWVKDLSNNDQEKELMEWFQPMIRMRPELRTAGEGRVPAPMQLTDKAKAGPVPESGRSEMRFESTTAVEINSVLDGIKKDIPRLKLLADELKRGGDELLEKLMLYELASEGLSVSAIMGLRKQQPVIDSSFVVFDQEKQPVIFNAITTYYRHVRRFYPFYITARRRLDSQSDLQAYQVWTAAYYFDFIMCFKYYLLELLNEGSISRDEYEKLIKKRKSLEDSFLQASKDTWDGFDQAVYRDGYFIKDEKKYFKNLKKKLQENPALAHVYIKAMVRHIRGFRLLKGDSQHDGKWFYVIFRDDTYDPVKTNSVDYITLVLCLTTALNEFKKISTDNSPASVQAKKEWLESLYAGLSADPYFLFNFKEMEDISLRPGKAVQAERIIPLSFSDLVDGEIKIFEKALLEAVQKFGLKDQIENEPRLQPAIFYRSSTNSGFDWSHPIYNGMLSQAMQGRPLQGRNYSDFHALITRIPEEKLGSHQEWLEAVEMESNALHPDGRGRLRFSLEREQLAHTTTLAFLEKLADETLSEEDFKRPIQRAGQASRRSEMRAKLWTAAGIIAAAAFLSQASLGRSAKKWTLPNDTQALAAAAAGSDEETAQLALKEYYRAWRSRKKAEERMQIYWSELYKIFEAHRHHPETLNVLASVMAAGHTSLDPNSMSLLAGSDMSPYWIAEIFARQKSSYQPARWLPVFENRSSDDIGYFLSAAEQRGHDGWVYAHAALKLAPRYAGSVRDVPWPMLLQASHQPGMQAYEELLTAMIADKLELEKDAANRTREEITAAARELFRDTKAADASAVQAALDKVKRSEVRSDERGFSASASSVTRSEMHSLIEGSPSVVRLIAWLTHRTALTLSKGWMHKRHDGARYFSKENRELLRREIDSAIPQNGFVLDLMAGSEPVFFAGERKGWGLGLNRQAMEKNPTLNQEILVRDLNDSPDFHTLPEIKDIRFDAVIISFGIMYLNEPQRVLASARSLLKPNGRLIIVYSDRFYDSIQSSRFWRNPKMLALKSHEQLLRVWLEQARFSINVEHRLIQPAKLEKKKGFLSNRPVDPEFEIVIAAPGRSEMRREGKEELKTIVKNLVQARDGKFLSIKLIVKQFTAFQAKWLDAFKRETLVGMIADSSRPAWEDFAIRNVREPIDLIWSLMVNMHGTLLFDLAVLLTSLEAEQRIEFFKSVALAQRLLRRLDKEESLGEAAGISVQERDFFNAVSEYNFAPTSFDSMREALQTIRIEFISHFLMRLRMQQMFAESQEDHEEIIQFLREWLPDVRAAMKGARFEVDDKGIVLSSGDGVTNAVLERFRGEENFDTTIDLERYLEFGRQENIADIIHFLILRQHGSMLEEMEKTAALGKDALRLLLEGFLLYLEIRHTQNPDLAAAAAQLPMNPFPVSLEVVNSGLGRLLEKMPQSTDFAPLRTKVEEWQRQAVQCVRAEMRNSSDARGAAARSEVRYLTKREFKKNFENKFDEVINFATGGSWLRFIGIWNVIEEDDFAYYRDVRRYTFNCGWKTFSFFSKTGQPNEFAEIEAEHHVASLAAEWDVGPQTLLIRLEKNPMLISRPIRGRNLSSSGWNLKKAKALGHAIGRLHAAGIYHFDLIDTDRLQRNRGLADRHIYWDQQDGKIRFIDFGYSKKNAAREVLEMERERLNKALQKKMKKFNPAKAAHYFQLGYEAGRLSEPPLGPVSIRSIFHPDHKLYLLGMLGLSGFTHLSFVVWRMFTMGSADYFTALNWLPDASYPFMLISIAVWVVYVMGTFRNVPETSLRFLQRIIFFGIPAFLAAAEIFGPLVIVKGPGAVFSWMDLFGIALGAGFSRSIYSFKKPQNSKRPQSRSEMRGVWRAESTGQLLAQVNRFGKSFREEFPENKEGIGKLSQEQNKRLRELQQTLKKAKEEIRKQAGENGFFGPFVPSNLRRTIQLLNYLKASKNDTLIDLGHGDGTVVIAAASVFGLKALGAELQPYLFRKSELLLKASSEAGLVRPGQAQLQKINFNQIDFSSADYLFYYSFGAQEFDKQKLIREMKPGAKFILTGYSETEDGRTITDYQGFSELLDSGLFKLERLPELKAWIFTKKQSPDNGEQSMDDRQKQKIRGAAARSEMRTVMVDRRTVLREFYQALPDNLRSSMLAPSLVLTLAGLKPAYFHTTSDGDVDFLGIKRFLTEHPEWADKLDIYIDRDWIVSNEKIFDDIFIERRWLLGSDYFQEGALEAFYRLHNVEPESYPKFHENWQKWLEGWLDFNTQSLEDGEWDKFLGFMLGYPMPLRVANFGFGTNWETSASYKNLFIAYRHSDQKTAAQAYIKEREEQLRFIYSGLQNLKDAESHIRSWKKIRPFENFKNWLPRTGNDAIDKGLSLMYADGLITGLRFILAKMFGLHSVLLGSAPDFFFTLGFTMLGAGVLMNKLFSYAPAAKNAMLRAWLLFFPALHLTWEFHSRVFPASQRWMLGHTYSSADMWAIAAAGALGFYANRSLFSSLRSEIRFVEAEKIVGRDFSDWTAISQKDIIDSLFASEESLRDFYVSVFIAPRLEQGQILSPGEIHYTHEKNGRASYLTWMRSKENKKQALQTAFFYLDPLGRVVHFTQSDPFVALQPEQKPKGQLGEREKKLVVAWMKKNTNKVLQVQTDESLEEWIDESLRRNGGTLLQKRLAKQLLLDMAFDYQNVFSDQDSTALNEALANYMAAFVNEAMARLGFDAEWLKKLAEGARIPLRFKMRPDEIVGYVILSILVNHKNSRQKPQAAEAWFQILNQAFKSNPQLKPQTVLEAVIESAGNLEQFSSRLAAQRSEMRLLGIDNSGQHETQEGKRSEAREKDSAQKEIRAAKGLDEFTAAIFEEARLRQASDEEWLDRLRKLIEKNSKYTKAAHAVIRRVVSSPLLAVEQQPAVVFKQRLFEKYADRYLQPQGMERRSFLKAAAAFFFAPQITGQPLMEAAAAPEKAYILKFDPAAALARAGENLGRLAGQELSQFAPIFKGALQGLWQQEETLWIPELRTGADQLLMGEALHTVPGALSSSGMPAANYPDLVHGQLLAQKAMTQPAMQAVIEQTKLLNQVYRGLSPEAQKAMNSELSEIAQMKSPVSAEDVARLRERAEELENLGPARKLTEFLPPDFNHELEMPRHIYLLAEPKTNQDEPEIVVLTQGLEPMSHFDGEMSYEVFSIPLSEIDRSQSEYKIKKQIRKFLEPYGNPLRRGYFEIEVNEKTEPHAPIAIRNTYLSSVDAYVTEKDLWVEPSIQRWFDEWRKSYTQMKRPMPHALSLVYWDEAVKNANEVLDPIRAQWPDTLPEIGIVYDALVYFKIVMPEILLAGKEQEIREAMPVLARLLGWNDIAEQIDEELVQHRKRIEEARRPQPKSRVYTGPFPPIHKWPLNLENPWGFWGDSDSLEELEAGLDVHSKGRPEMRAAAGSGLKPEDREQKEEMFNGGGSIKTIPAEKKWRESIRSNRLSAKDILDLENGFVVLKQEDPETKRKLKKPISMWAFTHTSLSAIEKAFAGYFGKSNSSRMLAANSLTDLVIEKARRATDLEPVVVVDWGAGAASALAELGGKVSEAGLRERVRLVAFGDMFFTDMQRAVEQGVEIYLDPADEFKKYFSDKSIDILFSYYGLAHVSSANYFERDILPALRTDGLVISTGVTFSQLTEPTKKDFVGRAISTTREEHWAADETSVDWISVVVRHSVVQPGHLSLPAKQRGEQADDERLKNRSEMRIEPLDFKSLGAQEISDMAATLTSEVPGGESLDDRILRDILLKYRADKFSFQAVDQAGKRQGMLIAFSDGGIARIAFLWTAESFRQQGLAIRMLKRFSEAVVYFEHDRVELKVSPSSEAEKFYQKRGFNLSGGKSAVFKEYSVSAKQLLQNLQAEERRYAAKTESAGANENLKMYGILSGLLGSLAVKGLGLWIPGQYESFELLGVRFPFFKAMWVQLPVFTATYLVMMSIAKWHYQAAKGAAIEWKTARIFALRIWTTMALPFFFLKPFVFEWGRHLPWITDGHITPVDRILANLAAVGLDAGFTLGTFLVYAVTVWKKNPEETASALKQFVQFYFPTYAMIIRYWFPLNFTIYLLPVLMPSLGIFMLPMVTVLVNFFMWPFLTEKIELKTQRIEKNPSLQPRSEMRTAAPINPRGYRGEQAVLTPGVNGGLGRSEMREVSEKAWVQWYQSGQGLEEGDVYCLKNWNATFKTMGDAKLNVRFGFYNQREDIKNANVIFVAENDTNHGMLVKIYEMNDKNLPQGEPLVIYYFDKKINKASWVEPERFALLDLFEAAGKKPLNVYRGGYAYRLSENKKQDDEGRSLPGSGTITLQLHGEEVKLSVASEFAKNRFGETMWIAAENDPNFGPVLAVYFHDDFIKAKGNLQPVALYSGKEKILKPEKQEIAKFYRGEPVKPVSGREIPVRVIKAKEKKMWGQITVQGVPGYSFGYIDVAFDDLAAQAYAAQDEYDFRARLREHPLFGVYLQIYDFKTNQIVSQIWRNPETQTAEKVDFNRLANHYYLTGRKDIHGRDVEPRFYIHFSRINSEGALQAPHGGEKVVIYGIFGLERQQTVWIPVRAKNSNEWFVEMHGLDAYIQNPKREPDYVLFRTADKKWEAFPQAVAAVSSEDGDRSRVLEPRIFKRIKEAAGNHHEKRAALLRMLAYQFFAGNYLNPNQRGAAFLLEILDWMQSENSDIYEDLSDKAIEILIKKMESMRDYKAGIERAGRNKTEVLKKVRIIREKAKAALAHKKTDADHAALYEDDFSTSDWSPRLYLEWRAALRAASLYEKAKFIAQVQKILKMLIEPSRYFEAFTAHRVRARLLSLMEQFIYEPSYASSLEKVRELSAELDKKLRLMNWGMTILLQEDAVPAVEISQEIEPREDRSEMRTATPINPRGYRGEQAVLTPGVNGGLGRSEMRLFSHEEQTEIAKLAEESSVEGFSFQADEKLYQKLGTALGIQGMIAADIAPGLNDAPARGLLSAGAADVFLVDRNDDVSGLDPPAGMTYVSSDAEKFSFDDQSLDLVLFHHSLHFIENTPFLHEGAYEAALKEAMRALKPGGLLIIKHGNYYPRQMLDQRAAEHERVVRFLDSNKVEWQAVESEEVPLLIIAQKPRSEMPRTEVAPAEEAKGQKEGGFPSRAFWGIAGIAWKVLRPVLAAGISIAFLGLGTAAVLFMKGVIFYQSLHDKGKVLFRRTVEISAGIVWAAVFGAAVFYFGITGFMTVFILTALSAAAGAGIWVFNRFTAPQIAPAPSALPEMHADPNALSAEDVFKTELPAGKKWSYLDIGARNTAFAAWMQSRFENIGAVTIVDQAAVKVPEGIRAIRAKVGGFIWWLRHRNERFDLMTFNAPTWQTAEEYDAALQALDSGGLMIVRYLGRFLDAQREKDFLEFLSSRPGIYFAHASDLNIQLPAGSAEYSPLSHPIFIRKSPFKHPVLIKHQRSEARADRKSLDRTLKDLKGLLRERKALTDYGKLLLIRVARQMYWQGIYSSEDIKDLRHLISHSEDASKQLAIFGAQIGAKLLLLPLGLGSLVLYHQLWMGNFHVLPAVFLDGAIRFVITLVIGGKSFWKLALLSLIPMAGTFAVPLSLKHTAGKFLLSEVMIVRLTDFFVKIAVYVFRLPKQASEAFTVKTIILIWRSLYAALGLWGAAAVLVMSHQLLAAAAVITAQIFHFGTQFSHNNQTWKKRSESLETKRRAELRAGTKLLGEGLAGFDVRYEKVVRAAVKRVKTETAVQEFAEIESGLAPQDEEKLDAELKRLALYFAGRGDFEKASVCFWLIKSDASAGALAREAKVFDGLGQQRMNMIRLPDSESRIPSAETKNTASKSRILISRAELGRMTEEKFKAFYVFFYQNQELELAVHGSGSSNPVEEMRVGWLRAVPRAVTGRVSLYSDDLSAVRASQKQIIEFSSAAGARSLAGKRIVKADIRTLEGLASGFLAALGADFLEVNGFVRASDAGQIGRFFEFLSWQVFASAA